MTRGSHLRVMMACAALLAQAAAAQDVVPTANLTLKFGGPANVERLHLRLAAAYEMHDAQIYTLMPVAAIELGSHTQPYSSLLGVPLVAQSPASMLAGNDGRTSRTWLWIGAGLVGAGAVVALAGSGGGDDTSKDGNGSTTNCGISGDIVGPNPPVVDTNC